MYVYTYLGWRKITNKYDEQTSIGLLIVKYEEGWMSYISRMASLKSYILTYFIDHISIQTPEANAIKNARSILALAPSQS